MWTCLKLQTQDSPFLYLYLSKFIQIWTCMVPLSISKYLYLSLNWVGKDKCILSILLGYPFIEYNCTTRVNMSAYVLMCQWKYIFLCLWIPYEVRDYGAQGVWFIGLKWFICYDHWQVTKVPTGGEKFKLNHCYEKMEFN